MSVNVTSCADYTATYHVQLIGAMATEAALSLITNMARSTQGLELGFLVLFLPNYTQPHCDKQTSNISSPTLAIIGSSSDNIDIGHLFTNHHCMCEVMK